MRGDGQPDAAVGGAQGPDGRGAGRWARMRGGTAHFDAVSRLEDPLTY